MMKTQQQPQMMKKTSFVLCVFPVMSSDEIQELKSVAIKLCDFKMDVIKWQLNFGWWDFSLKSYLWFQIELVLRARSILKSRVWFQTKLHSTLFNYIIYCFVHRASRIIYTIRRLLYAEVNVLLAKYLLVSGIFLLPPMFIFNLHC